ncbi:MAG: hypothetical protein ACYC8S_02560 [Minisyncoccota bacterium]
MTTLGFLLFQSLRVRCLFVWFSAAVVMFFAPFWAYDLPGTADTIYGEVEITKDDIMIRRIAGSIVFPLTLFLEVFSLLDI